MVCNEIMNVNGDFQYGKMIQRKSKHNKYKDHSHLSLFDFFPTMIN